MSSLNTRLKTDFERFKYSTHIYNLNMASIFDLTEVNPWWKNPDLIAEDLHIKKFESSMIKWKPGIKRYINLNVDDYVLYTVRGPRQVGKTTLIKLIIRDYLESGINPLRICFLTCDLVSSPKALEDIIQTYINYANSQTKDHLFLFIDEITAVRDWQESIKSLWNKGLLKNISVVACGSHAMDIKAGADRLPGRTGRGDPVKHIRFVPMKFAEFICCYNPELGNEFGKRGLNEGKKRRKILTDLINGKDNEHLSWLLMQKLDLDRLLETYMLTGGIACAVNEFKKTAKIQNETYNDYIRAFQSDLSHWKRDTSTAKYLISSIIEKIGCKVHWNSLKADFATQPTIKAYVNNMYDCFALVYFNSSRISGSGKRISGASEKGKKIYILDPFIFHCLRYWTSPVGNKTALELSMEYLSDETNRGKIIETIIADHLVRFAFNLNPSDNFDAKNEIFFWRPNKEEIDFIVNFDNKLLPIESKYRYDIPAKSIKLVSQFAKEQNINGIVVSKDEFKKYDNVITIPASIFLTLI